MISRLETGPDFCDYLSCFRFRTRKIQVLHQQILHSVKIHIVGSFHTLNYTKHIDYSGKNHSLAE